VPVPVLVILELEAQDKLFLAAALTVLVALMHSLYPFMMGDIGSNFGAEFIFLLIPLLCCILLLLPLPEEEVLRNPNRRFSRFDVEILSVMMFFGIPVAVVVAWVMVDSNRQLEIEEKGRTGIRMGIGPRDLELESELEWQEETFLQQLDLD